MRNTIKQIASIAFVLTVISPVSWAEEGIPRFYLDYAVVEHSLKNDVGNFDEFMNLRELDMNSANFIAEFWSGKARRECDEFIKGVAKRYSKRVTTQTSKEKYNKLIKAAKREKDQCFYGVYYDHWDEINQMIVEKYKSALAEKDK